MAIQVTCPECGKETTVGEEKAGLRLRCRECGTIISIPAAHDPVRKAPPRPEAAVSRTTANPRQAPRWLRSVMWISVGAFVIAALGFRWWFNPPPPPPPPGSVIEVAPRQSPEISPQAADQGSPENSPQAANQESRQNVVVNIDLNDLTERLLKSADKQTVLNVARQELIQNGMTARFHSLLQGVAADLPEIQLSTEPDKVVWNKFTLYDQGVYLNAFQFTAPPEDPGDLFWCFATPRQAGNWYILPEKDSMRGFSEFEEESFLEIDGLDAETQANIVFQNLVGGFILPGERYIVWFSANDITPMPISIAARVVPQQAYYNYSNRAPWIARTIGLSWPKPVEPTPGGTVLTAASAPMAFMEWLKSGEVLTVDVHGQITVWDPVSGKSKSHQSTARVSQAALADDDKKLVLVGSGRSVVVWDLENQRQLDDFWDFPGQPTSACFSADGKKLFVMYSQQYEQSNQQMALACWSLEDRSIVARVTDQDTDGRRLQRLDNGVRVMGEGRVPDGGTFGVCVDWQFDLTPPAVKRLYKGYRVTGSSRSPDGQQDLIVNYWGITRVVNSADGKLLTAVAFEDVINDGRWLPDGRHVVIAAGNTARLYDTQESQTRMTWSGHADHIHLVRPSPDGKLIASASMDGPVRIWDASQRTHADFQWKTLTDSLGIVFKPIPAGEFVMGTSSSQSWDSYFGGMLVADLQKERPAHRVRITRPYYLSAREITVGQFRQFVEATGYQTTAEKSGAGGAHGLDFNEDPVRKPEFTWRSPGFEQTDDHPVVQVTWEDAQAFCRWLSEKEKIAHRLPSEAEWERACAGNDKWQIYFFRADRIFFYCCNCIDIALEKVVGNYHIRPHQDDGNAFTAVVGSYLPNQYGLYDMLGNVWELCQDGWDAEAYGRRTAAITNDPLESNTDQNYAIRGGSFFEPTFHCRSAQRRYVASDAAQSAVGFRVLREIEPR